jgi:hypothetical protein
MKKRPQCARLCELLQEARKLYGDARWRRAAKIHRHQGHCRICQQRKHR